MFNNKFNGFALWLATRKAIICPNVRDIYSAGGQGEIIFNGLKYEKNPQIVMRLYKNIDIIKEKITTITQEELSECWKVNFDDKDRYSYWKKQIIANAILAIKDELPLDDIIN